MRLTLFVIAGFLVIALTGFYFLLRAIYDDVEKQYAQAAEEPMVDMAQLFAAMLETDLENGMIDPARFRETFDRAYSLKHPVSGKKSSGLGLCFSKEAAELHNGAIALLPNQPPGIRAVLTLPTR